MVEEEIEKKEILKKYRKLLKSVRRELSKEDKLQIRKAFDMAAEAHKDMRRKSGEPYIFHPLSVAQICAEEIGLGVTSVVCALLHDVVEDTDISLQIIESHFGNKVATIIDGLTKISGVFDQSQNTSMQAENFRKMLLTLSEDVRVILIKIADRLHNMRTLQSMTRKNQLKIASETMYLYAPLAHRLGLYAIKNELEDLSVKYTEPKAFSDVTRKLQESKSQREKYIKQFVEPLEENLKFLDLSFEIKGRPKSIFSILSKMKKQGVPFEEVFDVFAIRVIVDVPMEEEKAACWSVYSVVTDHYYPNPDRLRDWISSPKSTGYESLHTTVMGPEGKWVEVQIRSKRMDEIAEKGYAAHWKYKDAKYGDGEKGLEEWLNRVREILESPDANAMDFLDDFKLNLFADEIFIFTPKGELKKLPVNSTTLDFAFEIHSDIGSKCIGAKVNNKLVPINHKLQNGDQVEILTSTKQKPNEGWLTQVASARAKTKIKNILKEEQKKLAEDGKEILMRKFKASKIPYNKENLNILFAYYHYPNSQDLLIDVATQKFDKEKLDLKTVFLTPHPHPEKKTETHHKGEAPHQKKQHKSDDILFGDNEEEMDYELAKCCMPIPGDEIFGFITVGEGIKIHRTTCPNALKLMSSYGYRIIKSRWANTPVKADNAFLATVKITGIDSVGIISTIADVISKELQVNMKSISVESKEGSFEGIISLYIFDTNHLNDLMNKMKKALPLANVTRIENA